MPTGPPTTAPQAPTTTAPGAQQPTGAPSEPTPNQGGDGMHVQTPNQPATTNPNGIFGPTQTVPQQPTVTRVPQTPTATTQPPSAPSTAPNTATTGAPRQSTVDQQDANKCTGVDSSAIQDGMVTFSSSAGSYRSDIANAADAWNSHSTVKIVQTPQNTPSVGVQISEIDAPDAPWNAIYLSGGPGQTARIYLNISSLNKMTVQQRTTVIIHELGHALGLADNADTQSVMYGSALNQLGPTVSDFAAANDVTSGAGGCKVPGVEQHDWKCNVADFLVGRTNSCNFNAFKSASDAADKYHLSDTNRQKLYEQVKGMDGSMGDDKSAAEKQTDYLAQCFQQEEIRDQLAQYLKTDPSDRECNQNKFPQLWSGSGNGCRGPVAVCVQQTGATPQDYLDRDTYTQDAAAVAAAQSLVKVSTTSSSELKNESAAAIRAEKSANPAKYPDGIVAGHVPDAMWTNSGVPPGGFMPLSKSLNSSIGAQGKRYPLGYRVSTFMIGVWDSDGVCVPA